MQILFVNGDQEDQRKFEQRLAPLSLEWDIDFAQSGQKALALLAKVPFDIIAVDTRLPDMSGAELFAQVMKLYPQVIRFALIDDMDNEGMLRSSTPAHQFILRDSAVELFKNAIARTIALRRLLAKESLQRMVLQIRTLPGVPDLYLRLAQAMNSPNDSLSTVGKLIERDPAMSARILRVVNSAYFSLQHRVSNPGHAVCLLGIEFVRSIILLNDVLAQFDRIKALIPEFSMEGFQRHSMAVSGLARALAKQQHLPEKAIEDISTAGLLHDLGQLVLVQSFPREYKEVLRVAASEPMTITQAELTVFDVTHAEIGAYLLGMWGLADPIVEACAFHHTPLHGEQLGFGSIAAIHIAEVLDAEFHQGELVGSKPELDMEYLAGLDVGEILPAWNAICEEIFASDEGLSPDTVPEPPVSEAESPATLDEPVITETPPPPIAATPLPASPGFWSRVFRWLFG